MMSTVLGDFNERDPYEFHGVTTRFYRKDEKFFVHTQGPDGKMGEFEITHTFGWYPLQQYLVPFPGGRLQCLPIAWDVKAKKMVSPVSGCAHRSEDWLYWTNAGQNWNGMCAECHSTNLKKNYDISNRFLPNHLVGNRCQLRGLPWARFPSRGMGRIAGYGPTANRQL